MARNILLRFNPNESLIKLIDDISQKLGVTGSALARMAIYDYCMRLQARSKNGKSE